MSAGEPIIKEIEISEEDFWSYGESFSGHYYRIHLQNGEVVKNEFYDQDPRYVQEHCYATLNHCRRAALKIARELTGESYWRLWRKIKTYDYKKYEDIFADDYP